MTQLISTKNKLYTPQQGTPVHAGILYPNAWLPGTDEPIPYDKLEQQFQALEDLADALPFVMGDMLNYAEMIYGESYTQISKATGVPVQRLAQYKWVMKVFPPERRYPIGTGIKYSHYRYVAGHKNDKDESLSYEQQDQWLAAAYANTWTGQELIEHLKANDSSIAPPPILIPAKLSKDATPKAAADWLIAMYPPVALQEIVTKLQESWSDW